MNTFFLKEKKIDEEIADNLEEKPLPTQIFMHKAEKDKLKSLPPLAF